MDRKIESLNGHVIVCGFGRMGRQVCEGLAARGQKFVILECSEDAMTSAHALGWPCVVGDATHDDLLERCRIDRAQGLVAALASDADNLLVVLTARLLNADVRIVSRVVEEHNLRKLTRAGAQEVICLYHTGAERLVEKVLHVGGNS